MQFRFPEKNKNVYFVGCSLTIVFQNVYLSYFHGYIIEEKGRQVLFTTTL